MDEDGQNRQQAKVDLNETTIVNKGIQFLTTAFPHLPSLRKLFLENGLPSSPLHYII